MDGHNLTDETGEAKLNMCTQQKTQNKTNNKTQETHERQFV